MTVRYLLCPGLVRSKADGQSHHVPAMQLAGLYGVPLSACVILPGARPGDRLLRSALLARVACGELVALYPRYDGDYRLPDHDPS